MGIASLNAILRGPQRFCRMRLSAAIPINGYSAAGFIGLPQIVVMGIASLNAILRDRTILRVGSHTIL